VALQERGEDERPPKAQTTPEPKPDPYRVTDAPPPTETREGRTSTTEAESKYEKSKGAPDEDEEDASYETSRGTPEHGA
jgi:hypothetical protein